MGELTEDAVPVEYAIPVDAMVEESVVDHAMLVEEPAVEAPTEAAIEVVAEEPPAEAAKGACGRLC